MFFGGFLCRSNYDWKKITTGKKRYCHLAVGWNKSQITVCRVKIRTPTITGKKYDRKKRYSRLAVGRNKSQITVCRVKIRTPTMTGKNYIRKKNVYIHLMNTNLLLHTTGKKYDRKKNVQSFATHETFYFYYVCT